MTKLKRCWIDGAGCVVTDSCFKNAETCTFGYYDKKRLDKERKSLADSEAKKSGEENK